jgi:hypothetical protein
MHNGLGLARGMHCFTDGSSTVEVPMLKVGVGSTWIEWRRRSGANILSIARYGPRLLVWFLRLPALTIGPKGRFSFSVNPAAAWEFVTELRAMRFEASSVPKGTR